jgi:hypothetical protein
MVVFVLTFIVRHHCVSANLGAADPQEQNLTFVVDSKFFLCKQKNLWG